MRVRAFILAVIGAALIAAPASAHRVHAGVTEITVNPRTSEMEIAHRVFAHDLVTALGRDDMAAEDYFATEAGLSEIGEYFSRAFRFADAEGRLFELSYVGAEVDGEFGWIYFTGAVPEALDQFIVDNDVLSDHFDDQVMMTNLRFNSRVRTAMHGAGMRSPIRVRFN